MPVEIDLLPLANATVTAPAGCGKTELIADALRRHAGAKPILVLTHTNAGVAALRGRLDRARVPASTYRLSTIDSWSIRLASTFPLRSQLDPAVLQSATTDYPAIRAAASRLLSGNHVHDVLAASYSQLIVDEYQDCTVPQHELVCHAAEVVPTVLLGDPLQAIFGWRGNEPPDWDGVVCAKFPVAGELKTPWRWKNAGTEAFGQWLLDVRRRLQSGQPIDLNAGPAELQWVHLDGTDDEAKRREAARTPVSDPGAKVIVLGDNRPATHQRIAKQTPDAITVEAVDLRDLVGLAQRLDFANPDAALKQILEFASSLMTNVGPDDILRRVGTLTRGTERTEASDIEQAALTFREAPGPSSAANLLSSISAAPGVRAYRTGVLRAAFRALAQSDGSPGNSFAEAAVRVREQNRLVGRPLAKRSVGSTLLLKGLEAEVSVVLYADDMDAKNLYVAMTRGSKKLVVCSSSSTLRPRR
ncbi:MAG: UvrD-helicase domain-containing protein [Rhodoblastus sp.]